MARSSKQFLFLAHLRGQESFTLLKAKHWIGAHYMAGYVVECSIKALIASRTHDDRLPMALQTHDLDALKDAARAHLTNEAIAALRRLPEWTHLVRYQTDTLQTERVVDFLNLAREIQRCLSRLI